MQRAAVEESPHGIPLLIGLDVIHGQFTIFPTPLAQAASFDTAVAEADARVSAAEARSGGVNWTFSPMVDVTRDPRWGRVVEGFGEDSFLAAAFGAAKVRAYQGDDLSRADAIAACLKHFVAYGAAEAGRDYNTTDVSRRRLRETYLEPFRAGVAAGAASVMAAFNSLNGTPMHAHRRLLTDVLKASTGSTASSSATPTAWPSWSPTASRATRPTPCGSRCPPGSTSSWAGPSWPSTACR